ncbi:hypothetical protein CLAIMM_09645 isoform 1 [Cladophialophora immunda]|nr:hypothetical protein CLAIMM_09645 isoform 1 [Cladophialophora immunda]
MSIHNQFDFRGPDAASEFAKSDSKPKLTPEGESEVVTNSKGPSIGQINLLQRMLSPPINLQSDCSLSSKQSGSYTGIWPLTHIWMSQEQSEVFVRTFRRAPLVPFGAVPLRHRFRPVCCE